MIHLTDHGWVSLDLYSPQRLYLRLFSQGLLGLRSNTMNCGDFIIADGTDKN